MNARMKRIMKAFPEATKRAQDEVEGLITDYGRRQSELARKTIPQLQDIVSEYTGLMESQHSCIRRHLMSQIRMMESQNYDLDGMLTAEPVDHNEY